MPGVPRVAVMHFEDMDEAVDQAHFADAITEDMIPALSRFHNLFVIGRDSTLRYKGQAVDAATVAADLDAHFILRGSIRRSAETIRVTARHIDASNGAVMWSDDFDHVLTAETLFAVQDEITGEVVPTIFGLSGVLDQTQFSESRGERPDSIEAYDCVLMLPGRSNSSWAREAVSNARWWSIRVMLRRGPTYISTCIDPSGARQLAARRPGPARSSPRLRRQSDHPGAQQSNRVIGCCGRSIFPPRPRPFPRRRRADGCDQRQRFRPDGGDRRLYGAGRIRRARLSHHNRVLAHSPFRPDWVHLPEVERHFAKGDYGQPLAALDGLAKSGVEVPALNG